MTTKRGWSLILYFYHICNGIKPQPLDLIWIKRQPSPQKKLSNAKPAQEWNFITQQVVLHHDQELSSIFSMTGNKAQLNFKV